MLQQARDLKLRINLPLVLVRGYTRQALQGAVDPRQICRPGGVVLLRDSWRQLHEVLGLNVVA